MEGYELDGPEFSDVRYMAHRTAAGCATYFAVYLRPDGWYMAHPTDPRAGWVKAPEGTRHYRADEARREAAAQRGCCGKAIVV